MYAKPLNLLLIRVLGALLFVGWFSWCDSAVPVNATPTILYVAPLGLCGTMTPCYQQLQAAVDAANTGDEIRVAAGTYTGVGTQDGTTQVVFLGKSITLRGGYHPTTWVSDPASNQTILDAQGMGGVLKISGAVTPVIESLHLTNGSTARGGGVYILAAAATLRSNEIYSNTATWQGGGVYLENSAASVTGNHIHDNTTGSAGQGGGVAVVNSPATLETNTIEANHAHAGGGVELQNGVAGSAATLNGNMIRDNTAFDEVEGTSTWDGMGGGIDIGSGYADTVIGNTIRHNTAKWGGGVNALNAPVVLAANTIEQNYAPIHGGGLYVQGEHPRITDNQILSNTAGYWGGGLMLYVNSATVTGNTFRGNVAGWRGGGMYTRSAADFDSNLFLANSAAIQGGGIFILKDANAAYTNTVVINNHAPEGAGIYVWGGESRFLHTTISNNTGADGNGVVIDRYPGLVDPLASEQTPSMVSFTNTILANQAVGIYVTPANTLTVNAILWYNLSTIHIQSAGATLTLQREYTGDPFFRTDGYHLGISSAALDRGVDVSLDHDVEGQLRPMSVAHELGGPVVNRQYDLGADEAMPSVQVSGAVGSMLTYQDSTQDITITVAVPPGGVTSTLRLELAPLPPPLPVDLPFPADWLFAPPFGLNTFLDDTLLSGLILTKPATVTLTYSERQENFKKGLDRNRMLFEKDFDFLQWTGPVPPGFGLGLFDGSCGPESVDLEKNTFEVPVCEFGFPTKASRQNATSLNSVRDSSAYATIYFFIAEPKERKLYLPLIKR